MKPTIFPVFRYADATAAIGWLSRAFSFEKQAVFSAPDGTVAHAELRRGASVIGISSATPPVAGNPWSAVRQGVYAVVDDVDAHHARAASGGARIAMAPRDTHYGAREYSAWDLHGHLWAFGTYPMGAPSGEPVIFPELSYPREPDPLAWLGQAFDLTTSIVVPGPDGAPLHAEMQLGDSTIMLNLGGAHLAADASSYAVSVRVDDPDAVFEQARVQGAVVIQAPLTTHYGARSCWVRDPEGFSWGFSTYRPRGLPATGAERLGSGR